jgi:hypothetical protein
VQRRPVYHLPYNTTPSLPPVLDYFVGTLAVFKLPPFKDGIVISCISILLCVFSLPLWPSCVPVLVDRHSRSWNRRPPCALFDSSLISRAPSRVPPPTLFCAHQISHHFLSWTTNLSRSRYLSYAPWPISRCAVAKFPFPSARLSGVL